MNKLIAIALTVVLYTTAVYYTGKSQCKQEYKTKELIRYIKASDNARKQESIIIQRIESINTVYKTKKEIVYPNPASIVLPQVFWDLNPKPRALFE